MSPEDGDLKSILTGFVAIIGPPNVGKSTLLNRLVGTKIAIVSRKPQTTRNRIIGILSGHGYQIVFLDTPGIHQTRSPLHESMVASAHAAIKEVDFVLLMIEMSRSQNSDIRLTLKDIKASKRPCLLVINKIDKGPRKQLLPLIDTFKRVHPFRAIIPISARHGDGVAELLAELKSNLKPGPFFFPPDMKTDQTEPFLIAEIIREKIYAFSRREIPYATAVTVELMEDLPERELVRVFAKIHVEKDSQKAIMIGQGGKTMKAIGRSARLALEDFLGTRVFLDLMVRVEKNWSKDPKALRRLGY
jgi:GTP-binding protein Era